MAKDDDIFALAQSEAAEHDDTVKQPMPLYDPASAANMSHPHGKPRPIPYETSGESLLPEMRRQTELLRQQTESLSTIKTIMVVMFVVSLCLVVLDIIFGPHH